MEPSDSSLSQSNIEMLLTVVKDENAELKAKMKRMAEAGPEEWKALAKAAEERAQLEGQRADQAQALVQKLKEEKAKLKEKVIELEKKLVSQKLLQAREDRELRQELAKVRKKDENKQQQREQRKLEREQKKIEREEKKQGEKVNHKVQWVRRGADNAQDEMDQIIEDLKRAERRGQDNSDYELAKKIQEEEDRRSRPSLSHQGHQHHPNCPHHHINQAAGIGRAVRISVGNRGMGVRMAARIPFANRIQAQVDPDRMSYEVSLRNEVQELLALQERAGKVSKGLAREQIELLPEIVNSEGSEIECAICMDNVQKDEVYRVLECGHSYHKNCIDKWLMEQRVCPTCKDEVEPIPIE